MRVNLWGVGTKSTSPAITAQKRINCYVDVRQQQDRTQYALIRRPGLVPLITSLGANTTRALWPVNTLSTPLTFIVQANTLYSINNAGVISTIGVLGTITGNVSMVDDGKYLVLVDGQFGYVYNMLVPAGLNVIVDGNFTTTPGTVTWQDNYFIVTSNTTRQFQFSQISPGVDPTVWPAAQIGFAGSGGGALRAGIADHSVLMLFGDVYTEFWQDAGNPQLPYSIISGSAAEFGLSAPFSLAKFDNSVVGLFQNRTGGVVVGRMSGFGFHRISNQDIDQIMDSYAAVSDALGYSFTINGHPLYVISFPSAGASWMFDGLSNNWTELQSPSGGRFWGAHFANFVNRLLVDDINNGNIYELMTTTYADAGSNFGVELWSQHIWNDDKFVGIDQIQVDVESGAGLVSGQGVNPVLDLQVSKDGGNSFFSVGFSSIGPIGQYTRRVKWNSMGSARDWVLKLRVTDPIKIVITGASAELTGASF